MIRIFTIFTTAMVLLTACNLGVSEKEKHYKSLTSQYEEVVLTTDLSALNKSEKEILALLIRAAQGIDDIFWLQTFGDSKDVLLERMEEKNALKYALINYGPWSRLAGHTAFYPGYNDKPLGAQLYPKDMSREEFENWDSKLKNDPHTMIRRKEDGTLEAELYSKVFAKQLNEICELLIEAADVAEYKKMSQFFRSLANDLKSDNFSSSEYAWMQMKDNNIDLVMRPLDTGEDRKFGYKTAYSTYIVVKDHEWSSKLERFSGFTNLLQQQLPVPDNYKQDNPSNDSEIFVYDAVYYAGHCNAGPKIIALYLPRDSEVQKQTGIRSMQLKNVMEAKFEHILKPIGQMMIHETQRDYVSSDAFFLLTAFHEIAASLGINNTVNGKGAVSEALREHYNTINATSTDLMALYMIAQLAEMGEISHEEFQQAYITSFASVMRSSRFGAAGAHGIAGMIRFNFFERENVFFRCPETLTYQVNIDNMKAAVEKALAKFIIMQGDGSYEKAAELINADGSMPKYFRDDIERINAANIPVDVFFKQGKEVLNL